MTNCTPEKNNRNVQAMVKEVLRLAVHLHIYYTEQWEEIKHNLKNLGNYPYDLYVTFINDNPSLTTDILAFQPHAKIWKVANRGYDIGPFIDFLHHIDLDSYDLILKLHTKGQAKSLALLINGLILDKKLWKDFLIQGLIGSPKLFNRIINAFLEDKTLGMVGAKRLITDKEKTSEVSRAGVNQIMQELGFPAPKEIKFIAGTMFICREHLLSPIKERFTSDDFAPSDNRIKDGTLAHAVERVFGTLTTALGYEIKGFDRNYGLLLKAKKKAILRFFYQNKITEENYRMVKIFKLPVYHKKLN